jgi:predicted MFS family arabinose efflux permease
MARHADQNKQRATTMQHPQADIPSEQSSPDGRVPKAARPLRIATALQVMVAAGNGLAYVALSLRVYQETHSTLAVTMVLLAGGVPVVVLAPVSGLLLDRLPMGRLLSAAGVVVASSLVGLAFVHSLGATVELVLLLAWPTACCSRG